MSFSNSKRMVLNTGLPKGKRYMCLNACFENVSFAIRLQFQTSAITYSNLRKSIFKKLNLIEAWIPEDQLINVLEELEKIRNKFIIYNNEYSDYRKNKKINGQGSVSKKDYQYLKDLENRLIEEFKV